MDTSQILSCTQRRTKNTIQYSYMINSLKHVTATHIYNRVWRTWSRSHTATISGTLEFKPSALQCHMFSRQSYHRSFHNRLLVFKVLSVLVKPRIEASSAKAKVVLRNTRVQLNRSQFIAWNKVMEHSLKIWQKQNWQEHTVSSQGSWSN